MSLQDPVVRLFLIVLAAIAIPAYLAYLGLRVNRFWKERVHKIEERWKFPFTAVELILLWYVTLHFAPRMFYDWGLRMPWLIAGYILPIFFVLGSYVGWRVRRFIKKAREAESL